MSAFRRKSDEGHASIIKVYPVGGDFVVQITRQGGGPLLRTTLTKKEAKLLAEYLLERCK